jgi:hypothetical protein
MLTWVSGRQVTAGLPGGGRGTTLKGFPSIAQIARRHSLSWAAVFIGIFVLLNLIDVSFWQQVAIAAVWAGFFASLWLQAEKSGRGPAVPALVRQRGRVSYFWTLVWLDWFGFLVTLCFAVELIWRLAG